MPRTFARLWWIAVSASAVEAAAAQENSARILALQWDARATFEVDPRPVGEIDARESTVDPTGNRRNLPPKGTST